jgi:AGZA family xanthine/uracil permease-like MFS transporter
LQASEARPALRTEIIAGVTTFLTAAYVIIVNPAIVADAGIPFSAGVTATVLVSFIGSCAMGLYAKSPILVAPGMGINALFTYTIVLGMHVPLETALGCTLLAGIAFAALALGDARSRLVAAVPPGLRYGVSAGIGLFLSFLGLVDARFVVADAKTLVAAGAFDPCVLTFLAGLLLTIALVIRKVPGALMIGMIFTTLLALPIGRLYGDGSAYGAGPTLVNWTGLVAAPDFSFIGRVELLGACKLAYLPVVFVLLFTNFIEAMSTFLALAEIGDLKDENGLPRNIKQTMHVDAISALLSGPLGTSPAVAYLESAAGIAQGGRTGITAVVCGLLFLPFMFFSPLLSLVPSIATAPTLVMVGIFMIECVGKIRWEDMEEAIPAFVAILLIPLSYSMTLGISLAFITHVLIQIIKGKGRGVPPVMWVTAGLSVALIIQLKAG